jgi:hypothetical protein
MELHRVLAIASGAAVALVGLDGVVRAWSARAPGTLTARVIFLALVLLGVATAGGLGSLVRDPAPRQWLYVMYGTLAFVTLPIINAVARPSRPRLSGLAAALGALWALALITRLFATG